jgi:hypothetical protein
MHENVGLRLKKKKTKDIYMKMFGKRKAHLAMGK